MNKLHNILVNINIYFSFDWQDIMADNVPRRKVAPGGMGWGHCPESPYVFFKNSRAVAFGFMALDSFKFHTLDRLAIPPTWSPRLHPL